MCCVVLCGVDGVGGVGGVVVFLWCCVHELICCVVQWCCVVVLLCCGVMYVWYILVAVVKLKRAHASTRHAQCGSARTTN